MGARVIDTYCHQCHMKCHVLAHLQDGRIQEMRRATCVKGRYAHEDVHHPARLRCPLRRPGPRVVSLLHGWWFPEREGPEHGCFEANASATLSNNPLYDPINGNFQVRAV